MPMLNKLIALACAVPLAAVLIAAPAAAGENHEILMLNTGPGVEADGHPNVFDPLILYAQPGDTVTFIASEAGHNSASKRGMLPDGVEAWNGAIDEEISITLTEEGIYGYLCLPHYEMGMVGIIVVGDSAPNWSAAKKVRHPGDARKVFRALFRQIEADRPDIIPGS